MPNQEYKTESRAPKSRAFGKAPFAGRVQRIRGSHSNSPIPFENRLAFIDHEFKQGKSVTPKQLKQWIILTGTIIFMATASGWLISNHRQNVKSGSTTKSPDATEKRLETKFAAPSMVDAVALTKQALANQRTETIPTLWHMGSGGVNEVATFMRMADGRDGTPDHFLWLGSMDSDDLQMEGVQVSFNHRDKKVTRLALLTPDEAGVWKIDFDAFAKTATPSWSKICAGEVDTALVRVVVIRDSYHNGTYHDEKRWKSYGLVSDDIDFVLHGYCEAGSEVAEALENALADNARAARVTLEIRRNQKADLKQFEITRVKARDWVVSQLPGPL